MDVRVMEKSRLTRSGVTAAFEGPTNFTAAHKKGKKFQLNFLICLIVSLKEVYCHFYLLFHTACVCKYNNS